MPGSGRRAARCVAGARSPSVDILGRMNAVPTETVLDFSHVTYVRDGRLILGGVNWRVESDQRWVILGPNGAGKTTLLRLATANDYPTTGQVDVLDATLGKVDIFELRNRIGFASSATARRIPAGETVRNVVLTAAYSVEGRWNEQYDDLDLRQAERILAEWDLTDFADRVFGTLSDGERKRAMIARAVMTDPELLLLDEPAAGLDLGGREELVARMSDLAADPDAPALVLVTHHVEEIPPGFSHGLILSEGKVVASGLLTDVLTAENLSRAFGQSIALDYIDGRYFARRTRSRAAHRRR